MEERSKRRFTLSGRLRNKGWKRRVQLLKILNRFRKVGK
jgi:hypothetical protein